MTKPTTEQLARINQLAKSPLTEDQVYVFNAKLIGDNPIPNRFERVTPNFLRKMAQQAKDGDVALMLDHSWRTFGSKLPALPFGRVFDSQLKQEPDGELALYADHYIVRGQTLGGISTNDVISAIDAGTWFDTSVGYGVTKANCSICGLDYYGGKCMHWRGEDYDGETCSVDDDDGFLMENSLVFDGAYPGAGVVAASKTATMAEDGNPEWVLTEDAKTLSNVESVLFSFSQKRGLQAFAKQSEQEPEGVDQVNELEKAQQALSAANGLLEKARTALGVTSDDAIEGAVAALKNQAELGAQYAQKVITEACAAGVRAMGDAFNTESMKVAFSNLPVGEVEKIRDTYEAQAKSALGGGGQHVVTQEHDLPANPAVNPQAASVRDDAPNSEKLAAVHNDAREALNRHYSHLVKEAN